MKFMACQGCFNCRIHTDCAINDEITATMEKIKEADAIVIGSPIYFMQVTGPVKNLYTLVTCSYQVEDGRTILLAVEADGEQKME